MNVRGISNADICLIAPRLFIFAGQLVLSFWWWRNDTITEKHDSSRWCESMSSQNYLCASDILCCFPVALSIIRSLTLITAMCHPGIHKVVSTRLFASTEKNCRSLTRNTMNKLKEGESDLEFSDAAVLLLVMIYSRRFSLIPEARSHRISWKRWCASLWGVTFPLSPSNYPTSYRTASTITSHDDKKHCQDEIVDLVLGTGLISPRQPQPHGNYELTASPKKKSA